MACGVPTGSHALRSVVWRPLRRRRPRVRRGARSADPCGAVDARQLPRRARRRLRRAGRRARRTHRRVRRADAGAGRSADPQPVGRSRRASPGSRPRAAASASSTTRCALGAEQMFLEVRVSNAAAIALYESEGFEPVARRANYYPADARVRTREDALVMRRALRRPLAVTRSGALMATREEILRELGLAPTWRRAYAPGRDRRSSAVTSRQPAMPRASCRCRRHARDRTGMPMRAARASRRSTGTRSPRDVDACTACGLCRTRKPLGARASGDARAEWLFVGEAPGAEEDARGEPFVGQAGRLLDNMLAALGHEPRERNVYIANVLKCRPPNNRTPEPREAEACRPYLERQIELIAADAHRRARQERRVAAARHRRDDREPARARPPLPGRAADRHLSSRLPAAQPARQGEGVGGSAAGPAHARDTDGGPQR